MEGVYSRKSYIGKRRRLEKYKEVGKLNLNSEKLRRSI